MKPANTGGHNVLKADIYFTMMLIIDVKPEWLQYLTVYIWHWAKQWFVQAYIWKTLKIFDVKQCRASFSRSIKVAINIKSLSKIMMIHDQPAQERKLKMAGGGGEDEDREGDEELAGEAQ